MENLLFKLLQAQKSGKQLAMYSCCSANPYVIEAVLNKGKKDGSCVLIAATANQCDQFGGYTGMTPLDFKHFCDDLADRIGFDKRRMFLGGDHLGPLTFAGYDEEKAMTLAEELVYAYVKAGFTKIHLDTSMRLASDRTDERLSDETIAARTVRLARVAEKAYCERLAEDTDAVRPVYIIGSEVPIPGGSTDNNDRLAVTSVEDFRHSVEVFARTFAEADMQQAFENVIAFVVQPGVEEKDDGCVEYDRTKAAGLCAAIREYPNLMFEAHSTDYQTKFKLRELAEDGFGFLNVGPALTYALREGLFALTYVEDELLPEEKRSGFRQTLDAVMLEAPRYWKSHYSGTDAEIALKRKFSFSDRCRYYLADERVKRSIEMLFENLKDGVPLNLLSQFMPQEYTAVRCKALANDPKELVLHRIENTIDEYLYGTRQKELT